MGYLRYEQGRMEDAVQHFFNAVRLDPQYVNAWLKLHQLQSTVVMTPEQHQQIINHVISLQPSEDIRLEHQITHFATIWQAVETVEAKARWMFRRPMSLG